MTELRVSDHAVLRYLERAHGLDIEAVRRHIAYPVRSSMEDRRVRIPYDKHTPSTR